MTAVETRPVLIKTATEWGVRHDLANGKPDSVDVRTDEVDARHWLHALLFCGNNEAVLVARAAGADGAWIPQGGAA